MMTGGRAYSVVVCQATGGTGLTEGNETAWRIPPFEGLRLAKRCGILIRAVTDAAVSATAQLEAGLRGDSEDDQGPVVTTHVLVLFLGLNAPWLLYDVFCCFLTIRRQIRGRGSSAVPLISLIGYTAVAVWFRGLSLGGRLAMLGMGVLAHGLLQCAIPYMHWWLRARWMAARQGGA